MGRKFHAGKFAYVEEGAVVATFNTLPKSYQGQDLEDLKAIGFYPLTDQKPLVESWETLTVDGYSIGSSTVSVVYSQEFNLDAYKAVQRSYIKTSAGNRILALDPSWTSSNVGERQRNALMKAVKLLRKITAGTASAGEIAIADALEAL